MARVRKQDAELHTTLDYKARANVMAWLCETGRLDGVKFFQKKVLPYCTYDPMKEEVILLPPDFHALIPCKRPAWKCLEILKKFGFSENTPQLQLTPTDEW